MAQDYPEPLVVVYGGAGYIGSLLVRQLLAEGYRVRIFDNFLFGRAGIDGIDDSRLEIIEGCLSDTMLVSHTARGADTVILLSAMVGHRLEDVYRKNTREINLLSASVVLDAAKEHGARRFLFASTDAVYGDQPGVYYETSTPNPISLYARLKLRMEERIMKARSKYFHPAALRITLCHGYSPRMRFDLIVNTLIRDAIWRKRICIRNPDQCRALIHVEDVARAFVACTKAHVNLISGEIFNIGANEQNVQFHQIANTVTTLVPDTSVTYLNEQPDMVDYRLSCTKANKILDFQPQWSLEDSMKQMRDLLLEGRFEDPYSIRYHNLPSLNCG